MATPAGMTPRISTSKRSAIMGLPCQRAATVVRCLDLYGNLMSRRIAWRCGASTPRLIGRLHIRDTAISLGVRNWPLKPAPCQRTSERPAQVLSLPEKSGGLSRHEPGKCHCLPSSCRDTRQCLVMRGVARMSLCRDAGDRRSIP